MQTNSADNIGSRPNGADHAKLHKATATNTQSKFSVEGGGTGRTKTPRMLK